MLCQYLIQVLQNWGKLELSQYLAVTAMMTKLTLCQCLIQVLQDWGKLELSQYLAVTVMMIKALAMSHTSPPGLG